MAFVVRSERKEELSSSPTKDIGPGQYLPQDVIKPRSLAKIAFDSNTYRNFELKKENMPGPGSYEYNDKYEKFSKMLAMQEKKGAEPLYKSLESNFNSMVGPYSMLLTNDKKKPGFGSKEKRFKINKKMTDVPGPGYYSKDQPWPGLNTVDQSPKLDRRGSKFANVSLTNATGSPNRVVTIPTKNQAFGYEINEKGHLVMNNDPDSNIRHSGMRSDTVGPGSYNVIKPKDWIKRSIDWSKPRFENRSKTSEVVQNTTMTNTNYDLTSIENFIDINTNNISEKNKNTVEKINMKKGKARIFKQITENRRKMLNLSSMKNSEALVEQCVYDETPGPGYYYKDEYDILDRNLKPEKFQVFGSSSPRFPDSNFDTFSNDVGPGLYFKDDMKFVKMNNEKIRENKGIQFIKKNDTNIAEKNKTEKEDFENKLGPGLYDPEIPKKKCVTNVANFGSLQKRFIEESKEKDSSPDPGSYFVQHKWAKEEENERKVQFRKYPIINATNNLKKEGSNEHANEKEKCEVPPIGSYNSDIIFSLGYKVAQKTNQYQSAVAPFSSMEKRFGEVAKSVDKLGPGVYYREKKVANKQVFPPFKSGEMRIKDEMRESPIPGPGEYNKSSYFEWNKKSFNILYI